jgi:hypothetical protein
MSLRKDESGQALAIGVFFLVLLALGMYLIATFGKHVKEKVHVQTTADALALSLATLEAQSFNHIAFANRAQAAHYVTILNLQGYVSFFSAMEHVALSTANAAEAGIAACTLGLAVPGLNAFCASVIPILQTLSQTMFTVYQTLKSTVNALDLALGSAITGRLEDLNKVLWVTEAIATTIVSTHLVTGGHDVFRQITEKNDPKWSITGSQLIMNEAFAVRNEAAYLKAFRNVGTPPFFGNALTPSAYTASTPDADVVRAQRIMTEIVNATRFDRSLTARTLPFADLLGLDGALDQVNAVTKKVPFISGFTRKGGESKLVGEITGSGKTTGDQLLPGSMTIDTIFRAEANDSKLTTGRVAASSDEFLWGRGSIWMEAADGNSRFRHCRAGEQSAPEALKTLTSGRCSDSNDPNHNFRGISPFMMFNVGLDHKGSANERFHQPDVYVWLHKGQDQVGFENAVKFRWNTARGSQEVDTTIARSAGVLGISEIAGIHAFARAQAYYHRPGNWEEPPNLFNPFWRSRLAPVLISRDNNDDATDVESLLARLGDFAGANVIFH